MRVTVSSYFYSVHPVIYRHALFIFHPHCAKLLKTTNLTYIFFSYNQLQTNLKKIEGFHISLLYIVNMDKKSQYP